ncbi:hypothetical protein [Leucobacter soli]|uniref:hypothetical protein n=1 Tax=Leucobacter soli TaxID=2812850 RepID=UPI003614563B
MPWCRIGATITTASTKPENSSPQRSGSRCPASSQSRNASQTNSAETATAAIQIAANPSSHHTARLRDRVFDGRIVPAVCQARIAMPEMIAAGIPTPSPIARMTPMAVSTTAMRC